MPKILFKTFLTIICLLIIWVIGLFAQLPLIPFFDTNYFVSGTNQTLSSGIILKQTDNTIIKIEIPNEFTQNEQCFDFRFSSATGTHILTVKDFSQSVFDIDNSEIKNINSYLFWENGSLEEKFNINNHEIKYSENYDNEKYVFFRTVFDMDNINHFSIKIKTDFYIDNKPNRIDTTLVIEKKHRLTWSRFRVH
ncbi:MAG: hypothetical protein IPM86_14145 [Saprospiraceae bacterium]|nr:hypothetical protein [Saprospiraceae bacterium]